MVHTQDDKIKYSSLISSWDKSANEGKMKEYFKKAKIHYFSPFLEKRHFLSQSFKWFLEADNVPANSLLWFNEIQTFLEIII